MDSRCFSAQDLAKAGGICWRTWCCRCVCCQVKQAIEKDGYGMRACERLFHLRNACAYNAMSNLCIKSSDCTELMASLIRSQRKAIKEKMRLDH